MKRDTEIDFHLVRPEHQAIHADLINWARWCAPRPANGATQPMFRGYKPYLYPEAAGGGIPIDTIDAVVVQKLFVRLPELNRWALQWGYSFPFIHADKACRRLAVSRDGLALLIHNGRTMLKNLRVRNC